MSPSPPHSAEPDPPSSLSPERIAAAIAFHGHRCPGLAIGLRAAERAIAEVGTAQDEDVVAVVETDMCGVDGIQFLTGCTLGKGNLILRDWGKMGFSFYRRRDGRSLRLHLRREALDTGDPTIEALRQKQRTGEPLTDDERSRLQAAREQQTDALLAAPLAELFDVTEAPQPMPARAPRLESLPCAACGEPTMESRTRRYRGRTLCIPCFEREAPR
jgi:formylmethanofuran dehydrogenase subunit E